MTQDPALFEDSPAIRAAVAAERRSGNLEATQQLILTELKGLNARMDVANGRTGKNEKAIEEVRDKVEAQDSRMHDRRLWERLDLLEAWRNKRDNEAAYSDGVSEGKVALRTSDKVSFGVFVTFIGVLVAAASKLL